MLEVAKRWNKKQEKKELIPDVCEIPGCGYTTILTRHRIRPGKSGGKYIPGNVIGLCPNHHGEAEMGLLPKEMLLQIIYDRLSIKKK